MFEKDKMNFDRILFGVNRIHEYLKDINSPSELYNDSKTFDAVIAQFINIGECAYKIRDVTKNKYDNIEWNKIIGMRNVIAHNYFGIDPMKIWKTSKNDLTKLKDQVNAIIDKELKSNKKINDDIKNKVKDILDESNKKENIKRKKGRSI